MPYNGIPLGVLDSRYANITVDTKSNILALTPTAKQIAYATDVERFYVADGSNWFNAAIPFGQPSTGIDMGVFPFNDDHGYGVADLSTKTLHNVRIGGYNEDAKAVQTAAIRYDQTTNQLQIYLDDEWKNIVIMTADELANLISYDDPWNQYDQYGRNIIHGHENDMGVFSTDHIIDGGLISDQI